MAKSAKVICRCGKVCPSMSEWDKHLKKKHPKWRQELEASGTIAEDREVFRKVRG